MTSIVSDAPSSIEASPPFKITEIRLRCPATPSGSLLAYGSCVLNGCIALNDIRLERGRHEGVVLVFPTRRASSGALHFIHNPISREAADALRDAFLGHLTRLAGLPAQERTES